MVKLETILKVISDSIQEDTELEKCLKYERFSYTNTKDETFTLEIAEVTKKPSFQKRLMEAYKSQKEEDRWRVDAVDENGKPIDPSFWTDCRMFVTKNGGTIAIRGDGDIISVCNNRDSKHKDNMAGLLQFAVEHGGTKLDSFDGNWGFYRHCGFEPVSWISFNKQYAPYGWDEKKHIEEPVVFFKYTGRTDDVLSRDTSYKSRENFFSKTKETVGEDAYDDAYKIRDDDM